MTSIRIAVVAALMLSIPTLAQALECKHTLAQYTEALRTLEAEAAQASAMADQNPLHLADVAYYDSVLRDARQCVKTLTPVVSASR